jgi:hypothetical protein
MKSLAWLDLVLFFVMEGSLLALSGYAIWKFYFQKLKGIPSGVRSGEKSRTKFVISYGVASVVVLQLVNSVSMLRDCRTLISVLNLVLLLHLFFFNGWFHEALKRIWNSWENRTETY